MDMQQKQLDQLRQWLTDTEDRISHMADISSDSSIVKQQIEEHCRLQNDLQAQQKIVDTLSHMVVVVDDNNPESGELKIFLVLCNHLCFYATIFQIGRLVVILG